jgi:hypothetical protein
LMTASGGSSIFGAPEALCNNVPGPQATYPKVCATPGGFSDGCPAGFTGNAANYVGCLVTGWVTYL